MKRGNIRELLELLHKKLNEFYIQVDRDCLQEGDLILSVTLGPNVCLYVDDIRELAEYCDDLSIHTDSEGKAYFSLLFLPST